MQTSPQNNITKPITTQTTNIAAALDGEATEKAIATT